MIEPVFSLKLVNCHLAVLDGFVPPIAKISYDDLLSKLSDLRLRTLHSIQAPKSVSVHHSVISMQARLALRNILYLQPKPHLVSMSQ